MAQSAAPRAVGGSRWRRSLALFALAAYAAWWGATGYYELEPGEEAVVLRLGAHARDERAPGVHFLHFPAPIERLDVVKTGVRQRIEFGDVDATDAGKLEESTMQTGDNNLVLVEFVVQYRVGRPFEALYRMRDDDDLLWDVAQAALREVVGREPIDAVLFGRKDGIAQDAGELMQAMLDSYESGLAIESVQIQNAQPPASLRAAFNDAQAARQDRTRRVNDAQGAANEVVPRARGAAAELDAGARAYRDSRVAEATGEAAYFRVLVPEYKRAPEVTRKRLYLETLEAVLPAAEKVIAPPGVVLPYLPLERARASKP